jgi:hypothetical protein
LIDYIFILYMVYLQCGILYVDGPARQVIE